MSGVSFDHDNAVKVPRLTLIGRSADQVEEYNHSVHVNSNRNKVALPEKKMPDWPVDWVVGSVSGEVELSGPVVNTGTFRAKQSYNPVKYAVLAVANHK